MRNASSGIQFCGPDGEEKFLAIFDVRVCGCACAARLGIQGIFQMGGNSEIKARTDRRSLPSRSPFWRVVCRGV